MPELAAQRELADVIRLRGGVPIKIGNETIGAVGVSLNRKRKLLNWELVMLIRGGRVASQMILLLIQAVTISVTITTTKITSSTSPAWSQ